jgi:hypothetical protein
MLPTSEEMDMISTPIWILTGVLVVVGVVWLISRAITKGQKLPMPTTTQDDTQDAPPADDPSR